MKDVKELENVLAGAATMVAIGFAGAPLAVAGVGARGACECVRSKKRRKRIARRFVRTCKGILTNEVLLPKLQGPGSCSELNC